MEKLTREVKILKERYKNHTAVAKKLGVSSRHYRYVRSTGLYGGPLKKLIIFLANEFSSKKDGR